MKPNSLTLLLLEDDSEQADLFCDEVEREWSFHSPPPSILRFRSEGELRDWWKRAAEPFPTLYVLDLLVRWKRTGVDVTSDQPNPCPPDEAGLRCRDMILQKDPSAMIIVWTVVDLSTLSQLEDKPSVMAKCSFKELSQRHSVKEALLRAFRR